VVAVGGVAVGGVAVGGVAVGGVSVAVMVLCGGAVGQLQVWHGSHAQFTWSVLQ
jgi:hypothetical protein